jgi:hypothetical protein
MFVFLTNISAAQNNMAQGAGEQQSNTDSNYQIMDILKIEASKIEVGSTFSKNCSVNYFQREEDIWVVSPFQRAEYNMVAPVLLESRVKWQDVH